MPRRGGAVPALSASPALERLLVTCEHGGNRIPPRYAKLFRNHARALATHRGYDAGALDLARTFSRALRAPLCYSTTSRLLVDLNRSAANPAVFSAATRGLPRSARAALIAAFWLPYRKLVEDWVAATARAGNRTLHLSCHSFTPVLGGVRRRADIGLLFDPARAPESALCRAWQRMLLERAPALVVRRNFPYRGNADGLTTHLRRRHGASRYAGIELEVNQSLVLGDAAAWRRLRRLLVASFIETRQRLAGASRPAPARRRSSR